MSVETSVKKPELIIGLVGPIGVDMQMVSTAIENKLQTLNYTPIAIRLTELMSQIDVAVDIDDSDPVKHYESRIEYANKVRGRCESDAALVGLGILEIREKRSAANIARGLPALSQNSPVNGTAYILRQLKRPEEVHLLREVYGRKFIQISVSLSKSERISALQRKINSENPGLSEEKATKFAEKLVERDHHEYGTLHGQRMGEIFHLGDVFVSALSEKSIDSTVNLFLEAFFGKVTISPTKDEYGCYIAASASLRSIDVSRQVGAALFSEKGEIISLGCNEVPAPNGGTYWADHPSPKRDVDIGYEANSTRKKRLAYDFIARLKKTGLITSSGTEEELYKEAICHTEIKSSQLMDITEYGRMTHAEMSALMDAARLGKPTYQATMYVTTFPCHNCAKHIVGIRS